jgi:hypothetical protein
MESKKCSQGFRIPADSGRKDIAARETTDFREEDRSSQQ